MVRITVRADGGDGCRLLVAGQLIKKCFFIVYMRVCYTGSFYLNFTCLVYAIINTFFLFAAYLGSKSRFVYNEMFPPFICVESTAERGIYIQNKIWEKH